jgi:hypothetical protein
VEGLIQIIPHPADPTGLIGIDTRGSLWYGFLERHAASGQRTIKWSPIDEAP